MNVGDLIHRGTLESLTRTPDGYGGHTEVWSATAGPLWCRVRALVGREGLQAMSLGMTQPHEVVLRYRSGVTPAMRFVEHAPDGDRTHEIRSVRDTDGKRTWLELLTEVTG